MGDIVRVSGTGVVTNGEAALEPMSVIVKTRETFPAPIGMPLRALGGSDFGIQSWITGGVGLNNIGLLVRTWGRFGYVDRSTFTIDDGSGPVKCVVSAGVMISPNWQFVVVTGISSCERVGDEIQRLLRVRGQDDIVAQ